MTDLRTTHRSAVTTDQIDHLGHMNVRFYGVNARRGTEAMLGEIPGADELELRLVDVYTRHHREQLLGAELEVRSGVVSADANGLRLYHELAPADATSLAATFVHRLVAHGDDGAPAALPEPVAHAARAHVVEIPARGEARSISLAGDPAHHSPSLATVRERGIAMRKPRAIGVDECDDAGQFLWDATPGLTWGGDPADESSQRPLYEDADGAPMGWATMETRMTIHRLPRLGDRIQAFGAVVEVRDKTSHRIQWAYDLDRGDVLTSFEVVNLAFDITGRRAISIPEPLRELEMSLLHPDLAGRR